MDCPVNNKLDVLNRLMSERQSILNLGVRRLGIFGSFASGQPLNDSDVDFLVEFDPAQKSFDAYWGLSQLLEQTLRRPVDLLTRESLSPHIGPRILAEVEYVALGE